MPNSPNAPDGDQLGTLDQPLSLGLGPLVVGVVSDRLEPTFGAESLRYGLLLVVLTHLGGSALNLRAARRLPADLAAARPA